MVLDFSKKLNEEQANKEQELLPLTSSFGRYSIISTTYYDNFKECVVLIFDSETGKVKKRKFTLYKEKGEKDGT